MLTEKEIEVIKYRKQGLSQKEIASKLKISQPAVSDFERNTKKKIAEAIELLDIIKKLGYNEK